MPFSTNGEVAPGRDTAPAGIKSQWRQRHEQAQLYARCQLTPQEYELYGFDRRDRDYRYMLNFLTVNALRNSFRLALNDASWKPILDNKWLFYAHYRQFDVPVAEVFGLYQPGAGFTREGEPLATPEQLRAWLLRAQPTRLVAKPVGGIMGKRLLILDELRYSSDNVEATTNTGETLDWPALAAILSRPPQVRYYMSGGYKLDLDGYLLQAKVEQHPLLARLAPSTTNTVRVVTLLDHSQQVHIQFTILRLGRVGNVADNWDRGGISVAVDPATGVLGAGVLKPKYGGRWMEQHPDTGERFTGQQLPYWPEVVALCRRAAIVTPQLRSVGWDVAITPTGPVLIEGNPDWDLPMVQVHSAGLLQPAVREQLAHFGLRFPTESLPPVSARAWAVRLREQSRERRWQRDTIPRRLAVRAAQRARLRLRPARS